MYTFLYKILAILKVGNKLLCKDRDFQSSVYILTCSVIRLLIMTYLYWYNINKGMLYDQNKYTCHLNLYFTMLK